MRLARDETYAGFRIVRLLGTGCTGTVYLAIDPVTGDDVALKIVHAAPSADDDFRRRFLRTSEAVAQLAVPGSAQLVNFGELDERLWSATEYVPGIDVETLLHQHFPSGMPHKGAWRVADEVAATLDAAHDNGVSHGDVKPANVLLSEPFSTHYRIRLTDFGHGYPAPEAEPFRYAAPEVLAGHPADARSDQFALAATVFHLLTGDQAFSNPTRTVTSAGHLQFNTGALAELEHAPDGLQAAFARAFAFDPSARFGSCRELAAAIRPPAGHDAPQPSAPRQTERMRPRATAEAPARRQRSVLIPAAAAVVIAVVGTIAVVMTGKSRPAPTAPEQPAVPSAVAAAAPPPCQQLDAAVNSLNSRQKLAQLLTVGVKNLDDAQNVVRTHGVGGIFITSWTDYSMLGAPLLALEKEAHPLPLAVSVDEEGGRVQRLKGLIGPQPSPRALVAAGNTPEQIRAIAKKRGLAMKQLGITIDFAPVVDVTSAPDGTVIGDRSFGANAADVVTYAGAYADGLRDAGLLPVLKHFPGHGHASGDSHKGTVRTPPLAQLETQDLIPYQTLTQQAPVAVMVGHMEVPDLTDTDPASLSKAAYDLLRGGKYPGGHPFAGAIFTDDLSSMGAITQRYSVPEAVLKALQAGADSALWITTKEVPDVLDRLQQAVDTHELPPERVDDAVRHVALMKNPTLCTG